MQILKTLVVTVVDKQYMAYVPLFVYCFRKAYPTPDFDVKIFIMDECSYKVNCELVPLFNDFPRFKYSSIALRFLIPPLHFKGFDAVYVTDIDMLIMVENPTLDAFHWKEIEQTKLCYSNSLRNPGHYMGSKSLSGLHYATMEFFERTEDERRKYFDLFRQGLLGLYREFDGVMLYRICERSGIGLPGKYKLIKRHHGIHLGNFRLFSDKEKIADRIPIDFRMQWLRLLEKKEFRDIVERSCSDNSELNEQIIKLNEFIRS
jgi:hypothetical protein